MKFFALLLLVPVLANAAVSQHTLIIEHQLVEVQGKQVKKIAINGSIPGPVLEMVEGDEAIIKVKNNLDEPTSIHWHGILLPGKMDGVPGLNGFTGIAPGETFEYRFNIRQAGTYWYHAHSGGQEQEGQYGALVIRPKDGERIKTDRDYVILLSDMHYQSSATIMANLKRDSDYYQQARPTFNSFLNNVDKQGFTDAMKESLMWGQMRMLPTDLADVSGYTFLVNGKSPVHNWTGLFTPGESVRLRFINASAMSFFDVRIPNLDMTIVSSDGQAVEPVTVEEFRFGVAETYDVIVTPQQDAAYTIVAEPIDRSGFATATLAPRNNMRGPVPTQRPRAQLTMADMGHGDHGHHHMHEHHQHTQHDKYATGVANSGWAQHGAAEGTRVLSYKDLRYLGTQNDLRQPEREIELRLIGSMERYTWTINGQKHSVAEPILLKYGERVRLKFINETMMAHPMHLHGMFMQLENGQAIDKLPNKHTIMIAPGDTYSALLTADEPGVWSFHCHLLYHMMSGMMREVIVARVEDSNVQ